MSPQSPQPAATPSADELRKLAESAARIGGKLALKSFGRQQQITLKDDRSEVTEVDLAVEQAIVTHIRATHPHDTFIGEESVTARHEGTEARRHEGAGAGQSSAIRIPHSAICWVIDPIDGTRNYIRDVPLFACSVAALVAGEPVAGAVYDPVHDVMYSAARGGGTFLDGTKVSLADRRAAIPRDPDGKLFVGIPSARRKATRQLVLLAVEQHIARNLGSAALHLALTAVGQLDAAVMGNVRLWDIAAGCLLVTEAGGVVTSPTGEPIFPLDVSGCAGAEIPLLAGSTEAHARLIQAGQ